MMVICKNFCYNEKKKIKCIYTIEYMDTFPVAPVYGRYSMFLFLDRFCHGFCLVLDFCIILVSLIYCFTCCKQGSQILITLYETSNFNSIKAYLIYRSLSHVQGLLVEIWLNHYSMSFMQARFI